MNHRLGIIDWGIGGISLYKLVKKSVNVPTIYFSDTGVTPYGKMSNRELSSRLDLVITWLKDSGATHILIGCNAASTAIPKLRTADIPILGVVEPAIDAVARIRPSSLGLIGGRRTIVSGAYRTPLNEMGIPVKQRIAQPLSALIESGDISSPVLGIESERILRPLKTCSHILLACTHYPAAIDTLKQYVSSETRFIDPAGAVVTRVKRWKLTGKGGDEFYTTGDEVAMLRAAKAAFDVDIPSARHIQF